MLEIAGVIVGAGGLALAVAAFVIGFARHKAQADNRREAMKAQADNAKAEDNRHKEAMASHQERMTALQAVIRNTAPRPGPAE